MAIRYLLDTNTVSYILKGNMPRVRERLLSTPMAEVGISAVTEAELRFGVARRPESKELARIVGEFLLRLEILPWDSEAAKHYARLRADSEKKGEPMGNLDIMIAAQAMAAGAILVTHDRAFGRIRGLKREDWTE